MSTPEKEPREGESVTERLAPHAETIRYRRGQEICRQGEHAEHWFRLVRGVARRCVVRPDGRRQIVDLLLARDFFGFTAGREYEYSAEAVSGEAAVARYSVRRIHELIEADPAIARAILDLSFAAMSRLQQQLLTMGRITAREKVGNFLVEISDRLPREQNDRVVLPVSRYDIADCLGISPETVSRSLTDLKARGFIALVGTRGLSIVDRVSLREGRHIQAH